MGMKKVDIPKNIHFFIFGWSYKLRKTQSALVRAEVHYFRLPSHSTVTLVVAGSALMSLETVMVPLNIAATIAL